MPDSDAADGPVGFLMLFPAGPCPELGLAPTEALWVLSPDRSSDLVRVVRPVDGVTYEDLARLLKQGRLFTQMGEEDSAGPLLMEWDRHPKAPRGLPGRPQGTTERADAAPLKLLKKNPKGPR